MRRDARESAFDLPDGESEIFFTKGLDNDFARRELICPSGKSVVVDTAEMRSQAAFDAHRFAHRRS
jgi:hypothetical protein